MTTEIAERDLVEEVEELLAKAPKHNEPNHVSNGWVIGYYEGVEFRKVAKFYRKPALNFFEAAPELLRRMVEEVKRLRQERNELRSQVEEHNYMSMFSDTHVGDD